MHKVRFVVVCATLLAALTNAQTATLRYLSGGPRPRAYMAQRVDPRRIEAPVATCRCLTIPRRSRCNGCRTSLRGASLRARGSCISMPPIATRPMKGAPAPAPTVAQRGLRGTEGTLAQVASGALGFGADDERVIIAELLDRSPRSCRWRHRLESLGWRADWRSLARE